MSWVKTDDGAPEHLKLREAGTAGYALWSAGLAFCNRNLTDGRIDKRLLADVWRPIGETFKHTVAAARLVAQGLWHEPGHTCTSKMCPANTELSQRLDRTENAYTIHDYFEYQRSKREVIAGREATAKRVSRHRERKLIADATGSVTNAERNAAGNAVTLAVGNATPVPDPVPDPILSERDLGGPLTIGDIERLCYPRCGQLGGSNQARISALMPIHAEELEAALRTPGKSWAYLAKVIASIREQRASPAPPAYQQPGGGRVGHHPGSRPEEFVDGIVDLKALRP